MRMKGGQVVSVKIMALRHRAAGSEQRRPRLIVNRRDAKTMYRGELGRQVVV